MISSGYRFGAAIAVIAMFGTALPAAAQINAGRRGSVEKQRGAVQATLPQCARPLGTLAISLPETNWWGGLGLGSPEALVRVYVQQSKCFRLVNRSARGMEAMQRERDLAGGGELRRGGVVGKGQMVEADFTVIPDIVTANGNRGGTNVGGLIGGFMGGTLGGIVGGINVKKRVANVVLNTINNKTSEEYVAEGQAKKTDVGFGGGGAIFGGGFLGAGGASTYQDTEIGQVVALAYLDAYAKMVGDIQGMAQTIAGPAEQKAVTMKRPGRMFATASVKGRVIKALDPGSILYPTGNKSVGFWEVEDELGTKGWVSEAVIEVAR